MHCGRRCRASARTSGADRTVTRHRTMQRCDTVRVAYRYERRHRYAAYRGLHAQAPPTPLLRIGPSPAIVCRAPEPCFTLCRLAQLASTDAELPRFPAPKHAAAAAASSYCPRHGLRTFASAHLASFGGASPRTPLIILHYPPQALLQERLVGAPRAPRAAAAVPRRGRPYEEGDAYEEGAWPY